MKKTMSFKRIVSVLSVFVIIFSFMTVPASAKTITEAKNSVVAVINASGTGYGTGFAIGEVGKPVKYIVTNNHVVEGQTNTTATVAFDLASNEMMSANIYYYDEAKDVAILELPKETTQREAMVLMPVDNADMDDAYAALGYPAGQVTDWPRYNTSDITVTKGGIKKLDRIEGQRVLMLDIEITHGNSGGPLVNSKGEVVGINTFGINGNKYAITIDEIIKIAEAEKIPVTVGPVIPWLLIGGIALLVIIIVLVVLLIVLKSRGGRNVEYVVSNPTVPIEEPVVAAPVNSGSQRPTARLIAIGGTMNGKRFNLSGTIRIGRDASKCSIAFPINTQGVSGVHCELAFDGSVGYIKDLGSSYGTYTIDGRKLAPNTPHILKSGDKFYLASPENTFEIRI